MDRIVDLHTHILPGVDDGSKNIDESIKIINSLYEKGITDIVLTSHYINNTKYNRNLISREKIFKNLVSKLKNKKVKLYLGNEVFISEDIIELLEKHEISTINNTKYMLIEFPLNNSLTKFQNILCELNDYGIIPIIAHPERYKFLQNNKRRIREILEFNCLLQCNIDSLNGKYGLKAKRLMKWLLKNDLVTCVATDIHSLDTSNNLEKAYKKLKRKVGKSKYSELTEINPLKILNNKDVYGNLDYLMKEEKRKK